MDTSADSPDGLINFLTNYNKITINNFEILKKLGSGGFSTVYLVQKKDTSELMAMKAIKKREIIEKRQFEELRREKQILHGLNHPFLVNLKCAFQNNDKVFFIMPFVQGGDLELHLRTRQTFSEPDAKFYAAQIILA